MIEKLRSTVRRKTAEIRKLNYYLEDPKYDFLFKELQPEVGELLKAIEALDIESFFFKFEEIVPLDMMSVRELRQVARQYGLQHYNLFKKEELLDKIKELKEWLVLKRHESQHGMTSTNPILDEQESN